MLLFLKCNINDEVTIDKLLAVPISNSLVCELYKLIKPMTSEVPDEIKDLQSNVALNMLTDL
jgi:hypothetical protein